KFSLAMNVSTLVGNYAVVLFFMTLGWATTVRQADNRWGLKLLCVGLLIVLFGSQSRGALAGFMGGCGVLFALYLGKHFGLKFTWGLIGLGVFVLSATLIFFATRSSSS